MTLTLQAREEVVSREKEVERLDFRVKEAAAQVREWLGQNSQSGDSDWVVETMDNSQMVGINSAAVHLALGSSVKGKFHGQTGDVVDTEMIRVVGEFLTARLAHSTVIVMEGLGEGVSLCLVLPHTSSHTGDGVECHSPLLARTRLEVTLPSITVTSRLSLAAHLRALQVNRLLSQEAQFSVLSSQQGLRLGDLFHVASLHVQGEDRGVREKTGDKHEGVSVTLDRPFTFLVEQKTSNRTILMGTFLRPDDDRQ